MLVLQVIGKHNSGKTTLIEFLSEELNKHNLKVGYIKHDPKGKGITDKEGSDTYRVKKNTVKTALVSPQITTLWINKNLSLKEVLKFFEDCDIVIVEGFKFEKGFPKIVVGDLEDDIKGKVSNTIFTVEGQKDYYKILNWVLNQIETKKGENDY